MDYEVFISYRRDGGSEMAQLLYDRLTDHGIDTFLDVEELRSGAFNTQLYEVIDRCRKIVLVLPPHGLDRCNDPNDWVRLELEHALARGKTIIPISLRNFSFPTDLPESLSSLPNFERIEAHDGTVFDAYVERLVKLIDDGDDHISAKRTVIDMANARIFASCGLENTVFKSKLHPSGTQIDFSINFEPSRIRKEIPDYAGVYFLFDKHFRATAENKLSFELWSPDASVTEVQLEIKPEGRGWMHEVFRCSIGQSPVATVIDLSRCQNKKTLHNIGEITFVFDPTCFTEENDLTGRFSLRNIKII